jgi:transcriptional regulator with XRE-family HTH domain
VLGVKEDLLGSACAVQDVLPSWATLCYSPSVARQKESMNQILRELRSSRGRSLREAAKDLGVAPSHLSRVERGEKVPSAALRERAANYYKVPLEEVHLALGSIPDDIAEIIRRHPEVIAQLRTRYGPAS